MARQLILLDVRLEVCFAGLRLIGRGTNTACSAASTRLIRRLHPRLILSLRPRQCILLGTAFDLDPLLFTDLLLDLPPDSLSLRKVAMFSNLASACALCYSSALIIAMQ
jgi:hypothetical protein